MNSAWWYRVLTGLCEIGWAFGLKYTEGFSKLMPTIITVVIMILSFVLLAQAMRTLPVGTAYASWTGIGAVGTTILGIILFNDPNDALCLLCIGLIIAGLLGLRFLAKE
ncbi:DMT family transporter [Rufibacter hautae]|uniref:Guanidinium exporter n=1 Tax=Rufibacter hautae TaxID=2595005 RepID=A0A5B6T8N6_9BACT|nr:multidrug efflux SMR transporter [Rufibacter hautae]KAA3436528.1 multidrug efflux SMR transporter [Rufibacter hautae]